jgi:ABC-2 type transport system ATP-binding protein
MQVQEYLNFMAELRGLKGKTKRQSIDEALEATGLLDRRFQEISTLSKGYKQRVGLAQAIVHKPSILILDEPTNGLDPVQIQEIRALIKRLAQDTTILLSSHILSEIEAVCDRVIILIDGQIETDSTLDELLAVARIQLKLKAATDVEEQLKQGLAQIKTVQKLKQNHQDVSEFELYQITLADEVQASSIVHDLASKCIEFGWQLGGVSVETQSLESAFRELMQHHVERALQV